jgi:hypothetical protein
VVDPQAVRALYAESVRQVEQGLGDPAGHVGEDQVRHDLVGPAEPLRERAEQVQGHLRPAGHPVAQGLMIQGGQPGVGQGRRGLGARARIEERQLAEHLAGPDHAQQVLPAIRRRPGELDLAFQHHIELVADIPLAEQPLAAADIDPVHLGPERARTFRIERLEQRRPAEHVVNLIHGPSSPESAT